MPREIITLQTSSADDLIDKDSSGSLGYSAVFVQVTAVKSAEYTDVWGKYYFMLSASWYMVNSALSASVTHFQLLLLLYLWPKTTGHETGPRSPFICSWQLFCISAKQLYLPRIYSISGLNKMCQLYKMALTLTVSRACHYQKPRMSLFMFFTHCTSYVARTQTVTQL